MSDFFLLRLPQFRLIFSSPKIFSFFDIGRHWPFSFAFGPYNSIYLSTFFILSFLIYSFRTRSLYFYIYMYICIFDVFSFVWGLSDSCSHWSRWRCGLFSRHIYSQDTFFKKKHCEADTTPPPPGTWAINN